ncbi:MAG: Vi polysaccharide biosynthesis protein VipB/TviC [Rhizobacter sp.]|nr:Vi polysaccharide biosynthesis protein VipB/TviC [Rhizobacter sp.]
MNDLTTGPSSKASNGKPRRKRAPAPLPSPADVSMGLSDIVALVRQKPRRWLVTGGAGFIGSHLVETLLVAGQSVTTLDSFATGHRSNLSDVQARVGDEAWQRHVLIEGDITNSATCEEACRGADVVLHQAALGSVPRSLADPLATHHVNATGFLNMLVAARNAEVKRFVYAASSSTYGDSPSLPKTEGRIGRPLSPYAVTKYLNELYADVFGRCWDMPSIGLRYFNVFGARQDPAGAYAAVIPRWAASMLRGEPCVILGDGETSRDFCFVANAVQANLRAALVEDPGAINQVYNVAVGQTTSLMALHQALQDALSRERPDMFRRAPRFEGFRPGDVRHSLADIGKARAWLGYEPTHTVADGLIEAAAWYAARSGVAAQAPVAASA